MIVYVSAASSELDRAEAFMAEARRAGAMISMDWTSFFRRVQRGEAVEAGECVAADVQGVLDADLLVVLLPTGGRTSRGLWVEVGVALGGGTDILWVGDRADADIWGCVGPFAESDAVAIRILRSGMELEAQVAERRA